MAQSVEVSIDYDPEYKGIFAAANSRVEFRNEGPSHEGHLVVKQTVPESTADAVIEVLKQLRAAGVNFDGPISITTRKLQQIGGSDGGSYFTRLPDSN